MSIAESHTRPRVCLHVFVPPLSPPITPEPRKQFEVRPGRTGFNNVVQFIRFARVLSLLCGKEVHLSATSFQGPHAATDPEQNQFSDIAEIKADPATVRSARSEERRVGK